MKDLIARLEAATEGSRELDAAIWLAVTREKSPEEIITDARAEFGREPSDAFKEMFHKSRAYALTNPPRYTKSLDIAMTLTPDGWRVYAIQEKYIVPPNKWFVGLDRRRNHYHYGSQIGKAPTPALAFCIAALKACSAKPSKGADETP